LAYSSEYLVATGLPKFSPAFPNGQSGDTTSPGLVDELGGFRSEATGPSEVLLATIPMRAIAEGQAFLSTESADLTPNHDVLLFGSDESVSPTRMTFGSYEIHVQHVGKWQNPDNQFDVDGDGIVAPIDVLKLINEINRDGARELSRPNDLATYWDVSGDGFISPLDVLQVINVINSSASLAEGEGTAHAVIGAMNVDSLVPARNGLALARIISDGSSDQSRPLVTLVRSVGQDHQMRAPWFGDMDPFSDDRDWVLDYENLAERLFNGDDDGELLESAPFGSS
jgi:hypothetical protein